MEIQQICFIIPCLQFSVLYEPFNSLNCKNLLASFFGLCPLPHINKHLSSLEVSHEVQGIQSLNSLCSCVVHCWFRIPIYHRSEITCCTAKHFNPGFMLSLYSSLLSLEARLPLKTSLWDWINTTDGTHLQNPA